MHSPIDKNEVKRLLFYSCNAILERGQVECYVVLKDEGVWRGSGSDFGPNGSVAQKTGKGTWSEIVNVVPPSSGQFLEEEIGKTVVVAVKSRKQRWAQVGLAKLP